MVEPVEHPNEGIKLPERMTEKMVSQVLPRCTSQTRAEAKALMSGETNSLSFSVSLEPKAFLLGQMRKSCVGH
jgi:hypothetical protein